MYAALKAETYFGEMMLCGVGFLEVGGEVRWLQDLAVFMYVNKVAICARYHELTTYHDHSLSLPQRNLT